MPTVTVFAQQSRPSLDVDAVVHHARRFFATALDVLHATPEPRCEAAARVRTPDGERLVSGRVADAADLAAAEQAEARAGFTGLSLLAKRCGVVWSVAAEGDDDPVALHVAAILASVLLGPILLPGGTELIGVRTARERLGRSS
jgi:hypothetical protein